ncbi:MAG: hypothetical protein D6719_11670 [Candidatus Dadabacteria bacterium]|nr:MAG: hypothetical protein D6719_11670 [Candidatus Dadabacteria bacterium]
MKKLQAEQDSNAPQGQDGESDEAELHHLLGSIMSAASFAGCTHKKAKNLSVLRRYGSFIKEFVNALQKVKK